MIKPEHLNSDIFNKFDLPNEWKKCAFGWVPISPEIAPHGVACVGFRYIPVNDPDNIYEVDNSLPITPIVVSRPTPQERRGEILNRVILYPPFSDEPISVMECWTRILNKFPLFSAGKSRYQLTESLPMLNVIVIVPQTNLDYCISNIWYNPIHRPALTGVITDNQVQITYNPHELPYRYQTHDIPIIPPYPGNPIRVVLSKKDRNKYKPSHGPLMALIACVDYTACMPTKKFHINTISGTIHYTHLNITHLTVQTPLTDADRENIANLAK